MSEDKLKKRKTFYIRFTKFELLHLRDLMSILTPPDAKTTVSQQLAEAENRTMVEALLWKKIATACEDAEIPLGEDAPDFIVAPVSAPPISVFRMASEPDENQSHFGEEDLTGVFEKESK